MEVLTKAVCEYFQRDKIAPGILISYLAQAGHWYGAIHRFPYRNISGPREIVINATAETHENLIKVLGERFINHIGRGENMQILMSEMKKPRKKR